MKINSFRIKNYKGIVDTTIHLNSGKGSVYTLVGLNESGKTTILEAINTFYPDLDGAHALAQEALHTTDKQKLVPKKKIANFNEDIQIIASVVFTEDDKNMIVKHFNERDKDRFEIDPKSLPDEFSIERNFKYKNSEFKKSQNLCSNFNIKIKRPRARNFSEIDDTDAEWESVVSFVGDKLPKIVYFPTFLFDFPDKILISEGTPSENKKSNLYFKKMLKEALVSINKGFELQTHIVDRVLNHDPETPFSDWHSRFLQSDSNDQVKATLSELTRLITREVFDRWESVLGSNISGKKLKLDHIIEKGEKNRRNVYLTFKIEDGDKFYKVSERSLGFRWFFSFLLFTKYFKGNVNGESIFLFDEPAANLHSMAQNKLLDSFEDICGNKNIIIYSTHSHHMINPLWLENTFIVSNGSHSENNEVVDVSYDDNNADIKAQNYKTFVGQNASRQHYFQPILDRLQIKPVPLEIREGGVLVEGKSDFYILNWYKKHHAPDLNINFIPVDGAGNAKALMSLYLGTAQDFIIMLDSDTKGNKEKKNYLDKLPIQDKQILQIGDILNGKKQIEDLVSPGLRKQISSKYGLGDKKIKKLISRAFSEDLYGTSTLKADRETLDDLKKLINGLQQRLADLLK